MPSEAQGRRSVAPRQQVNAKHTHSKSFIVGPPILRYTVEEGNCILNNYSEPKGGWDSTVLPSLTAEMKTALQPPFHPRLDREQVSISSGQVKASIPVPRSELKKDFDKQVFGTTYF